MDQDKSTSQETSTNSTQELSARKKKVAENEEAKKLLSTGFKTKRPISDEKRAKIEEKRKIKREQKKEQKRLERLQNENQDKPFIEEFNIPFTLTEINNQSFEEFKFIAKFRSQNQEFRIPELEALSTLFGCKSQLKYHDQQSQYVKIKNVKQATPYLSFDIPSVEHVKKIATRSVTIATFYEFIATGTTYEELIHNIEISGKLDKYCDGAKMKFVFDTFGRKYSYEEQMTYLKMFSKFKLWDTCTVNIYHPDRVFCILADFGRETNDNTRPPRRLYFGVQICDARAELIDLFDVKKRTYIGTTSMESEMSLLTANQALARPGALAFDPFIGTGSLVLTCAEFGSMTMGSDIDARTLRGYDSDHNIFSNFRQHGLQSRLVDVVVCDSAHPAWKARPILDCIVADPPYGIRAGARKIGKKAKAQWIPKDPKEKSDEHIPQCVAYSVTDVLKDLLGFAAKFLVVGGRLVYWFPTTDQYKETDLALHPCLRIVANSEQPLSMRWRRRLITMEKFQEYNPEIHDNMSPEHYGQLNLSDASHANLKKYWFKIDDKEDEDDEEEDEEANNNNNDTQ